MLVDREKITIAILNVLLHESSSDSDSVDDTMVERVAVTTVLIPNLSHSGVRTITKWNKWMLNKPPGAEQELSRTPIQLIFQVRTKTVYYIYGGNLFLFLGDLFL